MMRVTQRTEFEVNKMNGKSKLLVFLLLAGSMTPVILTSWVR